MDNSSGRVGMKVHWITASAGIVAAARDIPTAAEAPPIPGERDGGMALWGETLL